MNVESIHENRKGYSVKMVNRKILRKFASNFLR